MLSRRLPPGSCLRLDFRAPERGNSRSLNHPVATAQRDFSALQTSPSRISAPAMFNAPQRLPPGSRLRLDFRAPERSNSSRWIHSSAASRISAPTGCPSSSVSAKCWFWLCFRVPKESKSQETHVGFSGRVIFHVFYYFGGYRQRGLPRAPIMLRTISGRIKETSNNKHIKITLPENPT